MSANALLLWMSARRQGSWQQFRAAVEELHVNDDGPVGGGEDDTHGESGIPIYQTLRLNLQRLGHAEFFAGAGDAEWRACPPSLAATRHTRGWIGILAGARSSKLLQRIHSAGTPHNIQVTSFPACPDQILFVVHDESALATLAERTGLFLQRDAPAALLTCLPPIDGPTVLQPCPLPLGAEWKIDRFSVEELRWRPATRDDAASAVGGLFRFALRHQRYLFFCSKSAVFRVPGQVGKYLVLKRRRRQIISYNFRSRRLSIPASCRPPFLIERALILCSGSLPQYQRNAGVGTLEYVEIPNSIAWSVAMLLRQKLR